AVRRDAVLRRVLLWWPEQRARRALGPARPRRIAMRAEHGGRAARRAVWPDMGEDQRGHRPWRDGPWSGWALGERRVLRADRRRPARWRGCAHAGHAYAQWRTGRPAADRACHAGKPGRAGGRGRSTVVPGAERTACTAHHGPAW